MDDELTGGMDDSSGGRGGKIKKILMIAVAILVIGAIGFFAGKMLSGGGKTDDTEVAKQNEEAKTDAKADAKSSDQKSGDENKTENAEGSESGTPDPQATSGKPQKGIIVLDAFTVNLNDPFGRRYIETVINLITDNKAIIPKIKENELLMPKIRHEIFMTISAKSFNDLKSISGKVTLFEEIMMRVNEILKEEMGVEPVIEVIETKFLIQ